MKVRVTFSVGDYEREAINDYYGKIGKADHKQVKSYMEQAAEGELETITHEYLYRKEEREAE